MRPQDVCFQLFADKTDYYHQWYHDRPMLITSERRDELRRMQALLYKCIVYMAEHYREWVPQYMPLDEKVMEILDRQSRYPFRAGAYRPDYLISEDGQLLLVEITCRFFGHGIWANYPSVVKAGQFMAEHPEASWENRYDELLTYMRDIIPAGRPIYVLKSGDRGSESAFYTKFYEYYGHEVTVYEAAEVEAHIDQWSHDAVVISALNQEDLLSFKMETLQAMIDARMLNDFRTIFLAHDKRFLSLIFVDDFTRQCLTEEETDFLRQHGVARAVINFGGNVVFVGSKEDGSPWACGPQAMSSPPDVWGSNSISCTSRSMLESSTAFSAKVRLRYAPAGIRPNRASSRASGIKSRAVVSMTAWTSLPSIISKA